MAFDIVIFELRRLVRKPPEDVVAKTKLYYLARDTEKNGLSDKQAEHQFIEQLKGITRMTIDKEIVRTLEMIVAAIQKKGFVA